MKKVHNFPNNSTIASGVNKWPLLSVTFPENHTMISLDVTSLFTNVPTELVLKGIDKRCPLIKKVTDFA